MWQGGVIHIVNREINPANEIKCDDVSVTSVYILATFCRLIIVVLKSFFVLYAIVNAMSRKRYYFCWDYSETRWVCCCASID